MNDKQREYIITEIEKCDEEKFDSVNSLIKNTIIGVLIAIGISLLIRHNSLKPANIVLQVFNAAIWIWQISNKISNITGLEYRKKYLNDLLELENMRVQEFCNDKIKGKKI